MSVPFARKGSSFDAEMFALSHASSFLLRWLSKRPHVSWVHIFSDSSSSLKVIFSGKPHPAQLTSIQFRTNLLTLLNSRPNLRIDISWVPGHKGIAGMKIADSLAKKGSKKKGPRLSTMISRAAPLLEVEKNTLSNLIVGFTPHPKPSVPR